MTAQLRCYVPGPVDETWGRLRHLGARRDQLIVTMTGQVQQMRSLLECVWPAALDTAKQPFRSHTWLAALTAVCDRGGDDLERTRRLGADRFERGVRREVVRRCALKPSLRIASNLFAVLTDPTGVIAHRRRALERVRFLLTNRDHAERCPAEVESLMPGVVDEVGLTALVGSITGLSVLGATGEDVRNDHRPHQTPRSGPHQAYAWPPGGRYGEHHAPTPSTTPATGTSPDATPTNSPPTQGRPQPRAGPGKPHAAWRHLRVISPLITGSPPVPIQPDDTVPGPTPCRYAGNDDEPRDRPTTRPNDIR
ncbi:hypothetical protein GCM10027184_52910 [Saccharothrix stipae]